MKELENRKTDINLYSPNSRKLIISDPVVTKHQACDHCGAILTPYSKFIKKFKYPDRYVSVHIKCFAIVDMLGKHCDICGYLITPYNREQLSRGRDGVVYHISCLEESWKALFTVKDSKVLE